jgi:hypothetical protein
MVDRSIMWPPAYTERSNYICCAYPRKAEIYYAPGIKAPEKREPH